MPVSKHRPKPKKKQKRKSEPKWESFERIVAAIHLAEMKGATVTWNEIIKGRQFDVTIRFKVGFYEFLTLIECRDYNKAVQVEKVEAFVTKAKHHKANKSIMVSAHGFQSGAKEVALRENIELYSLRQINKLPDDLLTDVFLSFVVVQPFAFRHEGEPAFIYSGDPDTLLHQVETIKFTNYGDKTIGDLIYPFTQLVSPVPLPGVPDIEKSSFSWKRATATPVKSSWKMTDDTKMILPDGGGEIPVSEFLFIYWAETARLLNFNGIDPTVYTSFGKQYEYKNELNNEVTLIDPAELPLGVNTILEEDKFYRQPQLKDFIYYCEKIEGEFAIILLIKSYQHRKLVRMELKRPITSSKDYVEITDETEIDDAKILCEEFMAYKKENPPQASSADAVIWVS